MTTAWAIGTVATCAVAGFAVWFTGQLTPLWLLVLPFMMSISTERGGKA